MYRGNSQVNGVLRRPIDDIPNRHPFHRTLTAIRSRHRQPIAYPPLAGPARREYILRGDRDRSDGALPARAHETGLTKNTRIPWGASQGILVPCVTTPGPHA
jgi:hypothetical protein